AKALGCDRRVIKLAEDARADGKTVLLAAPSHGALGQELVDQLGVFDGVLSLGDDTDIPLLVQVEARFGARGFVYLGPRDAYGFWNEADHIVTVGGRGDTIAMADAHPGGATHISTAPPLFSAFVRALRPHQWLKNLLIFLPVAAAQSLDAATLLAATLAFVAFSLTASSVYVLNDLLDLRADRAHPRKRERPFASGALPLSYGRWMLLGLLAVGVAVGAIVGPLFLMVLAGYYLVTLLYSFGLKKRPIIDICTLAGLYTLRIVAGGAAAGIALSVWMLAFSIFLFLSLAAMKRQAELVDNLARGKSRAMGRGYASDDLVFVTQMALSSAYVSVLVMALYINTPEVQRLYSEPAMLWAICLLLLYWLSRAVFKTHRGEMTDDPIVFATKDKVSRLTLGLMIIAAVLAATV
ncbi:MAG: UbiA family prenyltransferase, partial [Pseudomonadota bacterium]